MASWVRHCLHRFSAAMSLAHSLIGFVGHIRSAMIGPLCCTCTPPSTLRRGMQVAIFITWSPNIKISISHSQLEFLSPTVPL